MKSLNFLRRGGRTTWFHCFTFIRPKLIGHHTFDVISILSYCVPEDQLSVPLLMAAHQHDTPEHITGDIPSPFKRSVPGLRDAVKAKEREIYVEAELTDWQARLSESEARWLELADCLEGAFACLDERTLGNQTLEEPFTTFMSYAAALLDEMYDEPAYHMFCNVYRTVSRLWENQK